MSTTDFVFVYFYFSCPRYNSFSCLSKRAALPYFKYIFESFHTVVMKKVVTFSEPLITNMVALPSIEDGRKTNLLYAEGVEDSKFDSGNLCSWNLMSTNNMSGESCIRLLSKDDKTNWDFQAHDKSSEDDHIGGGLLSSCTDCNSYSTLPLRSFHDMSSSPTERAYACCSQPKQKIMAYTSNSLLEAHALRLPKISSIGVRNTSSNSVNKTAAEPAALRKNGKRLIHRDQKLRAAAA